MTNCYINKPDWRKLQLVGDMSAEDFKSYTEIGECNYSEVRRWDMTAYKVEFFTFNRKLKVNNVRSLFESHLHPKHLKTSSVVGKTRPRGQLQTVLDSSPHVDLVHTPKLSLCTDH